MAGGTRNLVNPPSAPRAAATGATCRRIRERCDLLRPRETSRDGPRASKDHRAESQGRRCEGDRVRGMPSSGQIVLVLLPILCFTLLTTTVHCDRTLPHTATAIVAGGSRARPEFLSQLHPARCRRCDGGDIASSSAPPVRNAAPARSPTRLPMRLRALFPSAHQDKVEGSANALGRGFDHFS